MTIITSNVPPPPRLTGVASTDLAAVTSWAYSMYRVLATDDGGVGNSLTDLKNQIGDLTATGTTLAGTLTSLRADLTLLTALVAALTSDVDTRFTATSNALETVADALDAIGARLDAIAAVTPVADVYSPNDLKDAINAIIAAAAAGP